VICPVRTVGDGGIRDNPLFICFIPISTAGTVMAGCEGSLALGH
jgi:hypothetical protein